MSKINQENCDFFSYSLCEVSLEDQSYELTNATLNILPDTKSWNQNFTCKSMQYFSRNVGVLGPLTG